MKKFALAILMAACLSSYANETTHEELETTRPTYDETVMVAVASIPTEHRKSIFPSLTLRQVKLLTLAQQIAEKDGHREPKLLLGLLMQESHAGGNPLYLKSPDGNHGVAQIRVPAARHVLTVFPEMRVKFQVEPTTHRDLIIEKLVHDDEFNVSVASKYLLILQKAGYSTMKQLALAYNQGATGAKRFNADTFPYVLGVMNHLRSFNK